MTEAAALDSTPHALLSATTAACATLQPMDAPITPCTIIASGTVAPNPHLPFIPQVPLTSLHGPESFLLQLLLPHSTRFSAPEDKTVPKTLNPHKPYHPQTVTIQDSPSDSSSDSDSDSDPLNY